MTLLRAVHWAAHVDGEPAPWDTVALRIYFPGAPPGPDLDPVMGVLGPDRSHGPLPVVVMVPGFNCTPELYTWLGRHLVGLGFAFVTFTWVGEVFPGTYGLTSGVDLRYATPDTYGTAPTAKCLPPILRALDEANAAGVLDGALDLDRVVLGGHSGGGVLAMQNSRTDFWPQLRAVFSYAAHSSGATMLGWPEGSVVPVPAQVPLLIMGGSADQVIAATAAQRYGRQGEDPATPVRRTFSEAVQADRGDVYYVMLDGGHHFSVTSGYDGSTARGYLDPAATTDSPQLREAVAGLVGDFLAAHVRDDGAARQRLLDAVRTPRPPVLEAAVR
jgi:pimeloyl-ACP methyl ester carboxylesterase